MARSKARKKRRGSDKLSLNQVRQRTAEALARESYHNAREYAKILCKQESTAEHRRLLIEATLGRAAQLRQVGQGAEARQILCSVIDDIAAVPGLLVRYLNALMQVDDWQTVAHLAGQVSDAATLRQIEVRYADSAILHGDPDLPGLQPDLQPGVEQVLQALAAWEQGNDTAAAEAIADIPDDSPLHDWKVLVQGLTAFYTDAPAALERWQALDPERASAAIATPFRAQIDAACLIHHPRQASLVAQGRQLSDAPWLTKLEETQRALGRQNLVDALNRAWEASQSMPAASQELRHRLAQILYWQVVQHGDEDEVEIYRRTFGPQPDDPSLHRLRALQFQHDDILDAAQDAWALYEQELTQRLPLNPDERDLARSLVWLQMGHLAAQQTPPLPGGRSLPFDDEKCAIDAVKCFRRSVRLAPQNLAAHEALITYLFLSEKTSQVVQAARRLLSYFPEHPRALTVLADDAFRHDQLEEAVALQARALQARLHDVSLRTRLDVYELSLARLRAQQGRFDEARQLLNDRLAPQNGEDRSHLLCRLAAIEFRAGQEKQGNVLFERACAAATSRLSTVFQMLVEALRMPLDDKLIQKLDREFRRGLKAGVDASSATELVGMLAAFHALGTRYNALDEHQSLILQYLKKSRRTKFTEAQMEAICTALQTVPADALLLDFAKRGMRTYPRQPAFPFALASYYLQFPMAECPLDEVDEALHTAEELVQGNPAYADMARQVEAMLTVVHAAMEAQHFRRLDDLFDDDDDDDDRFDRDFSGPDLPEMIEALANIFGVNLDDPDDPDRGPRRGSNARNRRRNSRNR
jgi:tetratricopeptide (TPR) repeat protein